MNASSYLVWERYESWFERLAFNPDGKTLPGVVMTTFLKFGILELENFFKLDRGTQIM
ncbi:MAG: hypothetical protein O4861_21655 [Trichodesmium sp. St16_bin4-tuft]|nr:hypothetical protein [Trichodesmium sp. ALOHA_ZT_67]MCL2926883.1 hypothetical protein [Trichodesmium sp. MAG_R01]MDE5073181.1 hypothetical protein [Trichodesmium sp. St5_bin8]MDE5091117.1 hypothetical protein [Trichodesmium sp. St18_bin3_1_1]MDE5093396.1 hypothetical protein [Trichodesmium sp. St11_bin5]MDE5100795.1 hypothetical protein [Trichodesmium sp. St16_bin4-tuft]MDE5101908.1 hypothetical protein [Trichodesmium sp. St19_bin2]MDT9341779.1 hypothetical protein [Trichodesmium erythrae